MFISPQYLLLLGVALYVFIGGCIFHVLEHQEKEDKFSMQLHQLSDSFLSKYSEIDPEDLRQLLGQVTFAYRNANQGGFQGITGFTWDLPNSIFFAGTVITTIGYGNLCPETTGGRVFCVIYGLFGIPLFLLTLTYLSGSLHRLSDRLTASFAQFANLPRNSSTLRSSVLLLCGGAAFLVLPALMFSSIEGWSFWEGIYYAFCTLATIGFGDFIAGMNSWLSYPVWYLVGRQIWLFLGLAWLALLISVLQEGFRVLFGPPARTSLLTRPREDSFSDETVKNDENDFSGIQTVEEKFF